MVRMATERISWIGLTRREVGSLSSPFFYSSILPPVWVLRSSAPTVCWQGAGSGPCPLQLARKTRKRGGGRGGMELLGRTCPHWPLPPLGHPKRSHRPRPGSSCIPGVVSVTGGCQRGGGGRGDGYLRPPRTDISADAERSS